MIDLFAEIIMWVWQLPQNIIGWVISRFGEKHGEIYIVKNLFDSGVCLGNYIIFDEIYLMASDIASIRAYNHEKGHQEQSYRLGWLYLIVIGLPSLIWNLIYRLGLFKKINYYDFYTEKWADKLGEVDR